MRWVKANIAAFGGDGDNIMIFGQSAGGNSVINHLAQPGQEKTNLLRCHFILETEHFTKTGSGQT